MKAYRFIATLVGIGAALVACNKNEENGKSRVGEEIQFGVQNTGFLTKTSYSGWRDGENMERINWVAGEDNIRIYSGEALPHYADYSVTGTSKEDRLHKGTIEALLASMKWGDANPNYFYSVYPVPGEDGVGNKLIMDGNVVTAVIPANQSYSTAKTNDYGADYYGNMKLAYMTATASGTPWGEDGVMLSFTPIVTTFYVTVFNPSDTKPLNLQQIKLSTSQTSVLTGTYQATIAADNSRTYRYENGGSYTDVWPHSDDNSVITFNLGAAIPASGSVTVAMFAVPKDISYLTLTVVAAEGTSRLDLKNNIGQWITFAGGCKHNLNNVTVPDWIYNLEVNQNSFTAALDGTLATPLEVKSTKTYGDTAQERTDNEIPTPWKTQIQIDTDDDDTPDTWIDLADATPAQWPSWMPADFPTGGSPDTIDFVEQPDADMTEQPVMSHVERLQTGWVDEIAAATLNDNGAFTEARVDLSKWNFVKHASQNRTTANCYIVCGPGKYQFPMVYGNAIDMISWNTSDNTPSYDPDGSHVNYLDQFRNHVRNATDYRWTLEPYRISQPWVSRDSNFGDNCTEVGILWKDYDGDVITNLSTDVSKLSAKDRYITFKILPENIKPGNAIIYVKDTGLTEEAGYGTGHPIAWSWHIWITDQNMYTTAIKNSHSSNGFPIQPVNLGWVDDSDGVHYPERAETVRFVTVECQTEYEDVLFQQTEKEKVSSSGHGLYYQWGRKDPLRATSDVWTDENHHVYFSVRHPDRFIAYHCALLTEYDWTDNEYKNLWKATNTAYGMSNRTATTGRKTVHDPCPPGYCIPPGYTWDDIMKVSGNEWNGAGWFFPSGKDDGRMVYLPADGYLRIETDKSSLPWKYEQYKGLQNQGSKGYYWTDFPANTGDYTLSIGLKFDNTSTEVADDIMRAYGLSARCAREDQYTQAKEQGTEPEWVY